MGQKMKSKIILILATLFALIPAPSALADDIIPALISISPTSGEIEGGETVTVTGMFFSVSNVFKVDGSVVSSSYISDTEVQITMPPHAIGTVGISAFLGRSGSVLPNVYQYIDSPDPEPIPEPTITVTPTPSPTPSETPAISAPAPNYAPAVAVQINSVQNQTPAETPSPTPSSTSSEMGSIENSPSVQLFPKSVTVYTGDSFFTIYVNNINTYKYRLTLQKYDDGWKNVSVAYKDKLNNVAFYGVPPVYGKYRIINVRGTVLRSFTIVDL